MREFLRTPQGAVLLGLVYLLFPLDLIPDIFGPLGRLDDLAIMGFIAWRLMSDRRRARTQSNAGAASSTDCESSTPSKDSNPCALFQLSKDATQAEIDARYRELMKEYHPDRVAHLGLDLQKLAHERSIEIQRAYNTLSERARGSACSYQ